MGYTMAGTEDALREVKKEIRDDYLFYRRTRNVLLRNKRSKKLIKEVTGLMGHYEYQYNHVLVVPGVRGIRW